MRSLRRDDSGAVAIVVAVSSLLMFSLAALVVDLGIARASRTNAQSAADAAALSGIGSLYNGESTTADPDALERAVAVVKKSAHDNYLHSFYEPEASSESAWESSATGTVPGPACRASVPPGWFQGPSGTNCILFRPLNNPREIRVVMPSERSPVFFGGVVGYQGLTIAGIAAEAEVPQTSRVVTTESSCVVCVLGPGLHDFQNGDLNVVGGDVWINGELELAGNGGVNASGHTVHVEARLPDNRRDQVTEPLISPTTPAPNPPVLAMPDVAALTKHVDPCVSGPGRYGGLSRSSGTCTLRPGLYVFTDPVDLSGTAILQGGDVTLYFSCGSDGDPSTCASDSNKPNLTKGPGARFILAAPGAGAVTDGSVKGLSLLYDDSLSATLVLDDVAAGDSLTGTIYGKGLTLDAKNYNCESAFRSMLVVSSLTMQGNNTCFATTYAAAENIAGPSISVPVLEVPVLSR